MKCFNSFASFFGLLSVSIITLLTSSCSDTDYVSAIPGNSIALMSVDASATDVSKSQEDMLKSILGTYKVGDTGIDFGSKIYFFETIDGNIGACAKVKDGDDMADFFNRLSSKGKCEKIKEHDGIRFTVLSNSWVIGFSDDALLAIGPVAVPEQAEARHSIGKYLKQDEDRSIVSSKIYERLDSVDSPVAFVAQTQALPEKFIAPFTLGAPKDADASQIYIAAGISKKGNSIEIDGKSFSFDKSIDAALNKSMNVFRPIKGMYKKMADSSPLELYANVDGKQFLPLLQNNKTLQVLLAGANTTIDMNKIIQSIDGDLFVGTGGIDADNMNMEMAAELSDTDWLKDVGYWMSSCPSGSRIVPDKKAGTYKYINGKTVFDFGVTADKRHFFFKNANASTAATGKKRTDASNNRIKGQRFVIVLNLEKMEKDNKVVKTAMHIMKPLLGEVKTVTYMVK